MAVPLSQATTIAQLQTYARDGSVDAVKVCPNSASLYDNALMAALQGQPFANVKAQLTVADSVCHNEGIAIGTVTSGGSAGATTYPSATPAVPSSSSGGWPWWLVLGGVGLGLWLLFGKKGKKKR